MLLVVSFGDNPYSNLRVLKMSGKIVLQFARQRDISSALIQWFSGVPQSFSHVDALLPNGDCLGSRHGRDGGYPPGVQIRKPGYAPFTRTLVVTLPCTDEVEAAFYGWLRTQIGKPYDTLAILAFAAERNWREDNAWFCDEFIAAGMEKSKFLTHPLAFAVNKLTPDSLLLVCSVFVPIGA